MAASVGGSGESLPSLNRSSLCAGWCRLSTGVNPSTWGVYRGLAHATTRAGRHPRRHAASACRAGVLVYVCLVWRWVSHCAAVSMTLPDPARADPGQALWAVPRHCRWSGQRLTVAACPHAVAVKSNVFTLRILLVVFMSKLSKYKLCTFQFTAYNLKTLIINISTFQQKKRDFVKLKNAFD